MEKLFITLFLTGIFAEGNAMNIKYFSDTDTALVEFSENSIVETKELSENMYLDIDANGNPVSITIEHARTTAHLPDISYQQIENVI